MKKTILLILVLPLLFLFSCQKRVEEKIKIYGWNILTDHSQTALQTIEASKRYNVNQLQLSHEICHHLKDVKHQWNRNIVNNLTRRAHEAGIPEVLVWDHALYDLKYYPERFKVKESGLINLDDPGFWEWLKEDYRKMLDKIPDVNGVVVTLSETGANVKDQYSEKLQTPPEKQAAFVDSLASLIIDERKMKLYLRSFVNNKKELIPEIETLRLINCPEIVVMAQETPNNFLVTHPVSDWVRQIPLPVIVEFDCAHEFEGQGNVASIFPEIHVERWKHFQKLPNVIGFSLRTDRYGKTSIVNRPPEINIFAIHEATKNPKTGISEIIEKFVQQNYDSLAVPYLKPVFAMAPEIILSSFYTLGLNTTNQSKADFNFAPTYSQNVSGRWMVKPEIFIAHDVNQTFHYWKDIVNHLAPVGYKQAQGKALEEIPEIFENNWVQPEELMDTLFLNYVLAEKEFSVKLAGQAISAINAAKPFCTDSRSFNRIYHTFNRTLLSARLRNAYAQVYFAKRIWDRGEDFQNERLKSLISDGTEELRWISDDIKNYRRKGPEGEYSWEEDTKIALQMIGEINNSGILPEK